MDLWSSMVLVVKSRWVFAIGVKNFIKADPHPALLQEMGSAENSLSWGALQQFLYKPECDCLQSKYAVIQQRQVLV